MSELLIREMTEGDLKAVSELETRNFSHPWRYEDFKEAFSKPHYLYYVAEKDGNIAGVSGLIISFDEAELVNVSVDERLRREGIAKALLSKLFDAGRERGVKDFLLEVRSGNAAAIALYEKLGFVKEGISPGFYRDPKEDALLYHLKG
ncbi:MAG: ribosomal protein S18-alanine N-acetyltransferase [Lachnospiraceae bacterium]|nr:ribosomal protein S18-alanine N-acetyltransferase [Lachnospiraceae bacterium]